MDDELEDAINGLLANEHEEESNLGIINLNEIKKKLFDPEMVIIL